MQRSMLIFENSKKSAASRKTYLYHLNKFITFFNVENYDGLASLPQEQLQVMMEDYVVHLKKPSHTTHISTRSFIA